MSQSLNGATEEGDVLRSEDMSGEDDKLAGTNECDITDRYLSRYRPNLSVSRDLETSPDHRAINDWI